MRRIAAAVFLLLCGLVAAHAEALVVQTCGTNPQSYKPGATRLETIDVNGNLCANAAGGGAASTNVTQWNSVNLGSPTTPGVSPSGNLIGVNTVFTNSLIGGTNQIGSVNTNPYASGTAAIPVAISGNATGTTAAVVGTLAAAVGKTTYICGFNVQAIGGTAAVGPITIAGLVGSSQVYQGSSSAAGGTVATQVFTPCIPASAANTAITITTTANGTATAVDVNSWGFQQ